MKLVKKILFVLMLFVVSVSAKTDLIINVDNRATTSLNGKWQTIVDPYEGGFYDYRYMEASNGFFKNEKPQERWQRVEYDFDKDQLLNVPGDWNTQREELFLYEGTIWYKKGFDYSLEKGKRLFVYFGAANYDAKVYLNGEKLGDHVGGFTPFNFEITDLVKEKDNFLIVKVDNKRHREAVPTLNTDWWNYGGLTRRVMLVETSDSFIKDYQIQLKKNNMKTVSGFVQLCGDQKSQTITIEIPEAKIKKTFKTDENGLAKVEFNAKLKLWSPENPKLYKVKISSETDTICDEIGFRTIETKGTDILLNGKPIFLRGVCHHEEKPLGSGRAFSKDDAVTILSWAKEMNCNFMRLAHYPHNEWMPRMADKMGILLWEENPVYWTILWENKSTFENAQNQLTEVITRDKNRASVILWSMANETPLGDSRLEFLTKLASHARSLDDTRLITAAMERHYDETGKTQIIDDPYGEVVDVLGCNEYIGWYDGLPEKCQDISWKTIYDKPLIMSEFGGGALYGHHGDSLTVWTEEYQEFLYEQQTAMLAKIPFLKGTTPWILVDFRSPRRWLPDIQDFWNRKGLISENGDYKKAFFVMQKYYNSIAEQYK